MLKLALSIMGMAIEEGLVLQAQHTNPCLSFVPLGHGFLVGVNRKPLFTWHLLHLQQDNTMSGDGQYIRPRRAVNGSSAKGERATNT